MSLISNALEALLAGMEAATTTSCVESLNKIYELLWRLVIVRYRENKRRALF